MIYPIMWRMRDIAIRLDDRRLADTVSYALGLLAGRHTGPWADWMMLCSETYRWMYDYADRCLDELKNRQLTQTQMPDMNNEFADQLPYLEDRPDFPKCPEYPCTVNDKDNMKAYKLALEDAWTADMNKKRKLTWYGKDHMKWGWEPIRPWSQDRILEDTRREAHRVQTIKRGSGPASRTGQDARPTYIGDGAVRAGEDVRREDSSGGLEPASQFGASVAGRGGIVRWEPGDLDIPDGQVAAEPLREAVSGLPERPVPQPGRPATIRSGRNSAGGYSIQLLPGADAPSPGGLVPRVRYSGGS